MVVDTFASLIVALIDPSLLFAFVALARVSLRF